MNYHIFNNLAELLNRNLAAKFGRGILFRDLIDRLFKCYFPSKVNGKCVYEGKSRNKCLIYKVKCSMCDDIYIGNTYQTPKKIMDGNLSYLLRLLKRDKNQNYFLPIPSSTLTLLRHVQIYVSI